MVERSCWIWNVSNCFTQSDIHSPEGSHTTMRSGGSAEAETAQRCLCLCWFRRWWVNRAWSRSFMWSHVSLSRRQTRLSAFGPAPITSTSTSGSASMGTAAAAAAAAAALGMIEEREAVCTRTQPSTSDPVCLQPRTMRTYRIVGSTRFVIASCDSTPTAGRARARPSDSQQPKPPGKNVGS
jgi:hypothetical protein